MSRYKTKPTVYILNKENKFVTKISSNTNCEYPNIVFLRSKVKITPKVIQKSYENEILSLKDEFIKFSEQILNNNHLYSKDYIFSVDVAEKSVFHKKTSHLRYDVFLKPLTNNLTLEEHKDILEKLSITFDDKLIELFNKYSLIVK